MKLFAWGVVPLRAGLHAYGVLSLVASVAWIKRGSHETCHRGAIVFATHVIRPLGDLFCAVSGVGWIPHGPCAPEGSSSDNGQLPAREGAKAQRRRPPALPPRTSTNKHHSGPINIRFGRELYAKW